MEDTLAMRKARSARLRAQRPDCCPVIVLVPGDPPIAKRMSAPADMSLGRFMQEACKALGMEVLTPVSEMPADALMDTVYAQWVDPDGFLYIQIG